MVGVGWNNNLVDLGEAGVTTALLVAWAVSVVWALLNHVVAYKFKVADAVIAQLFGGLYPMIIVLLTAVMLKLLGVV
jgi:hypothetical protein